LDFISDRSFDIAVSMYDKRGEVLLKNDFLLKIEDAFDEDDKSFNVPRFIGQANEKTWTNTIDLLDLVAQYAIAGSVDAWKLQDSKLVEHCNFEPRGDKGAVQEFLKGREFITEGKQAEARKALSQAIEKYEKHGLAYERRGHVNFLLGNNQDALYDFGKSIDFSPNSPDAYIGRAQVHMANKEIDKAILDLDAATKCSIPHQPVYWRARRTKGSCHLQLQQHKEAAFELKLFTRRSFPADNPNYKWRKKAFYDYGQALLGLGQYSEALDAFNQALQLDGNGQIDRGEQFFLRGLAAKEAGRSDYFSDWKKAAEHGHQQARQQLSATA